MIESDHGFIFECRSDIIGFLLNSTLFVLPQCFLKNSSTVLNLFFFYFRRAKIKLDYLSCFYFGFCLTQLLLKLFV
jgi:hypothetical protein